MTSESFTKCHNCGAIVNPALGAEAPTGEAHEGTYDDPRAPGDYDNVCDVCNYRDDVRGWAE